MIFDKLENLEKYASVHPRFAKAIPFLKELIATNPTNGRYYMPDADAEGAVFANVNSYETGACTATSQMETHQKYIDIQIILEGQETIYLPSLESLGAVTKAYDATADYEMATIPSPESCIRLNVSAGSFAIFFTGEPHAPNLAVNGQTTFVRKVVGKVLV